MRSLAPRACLDVPCPGANCQVGYRGVLGLPGAMGDEAVISVCFCQLHGLKGFRQGADLIQFDQDGVGDSLLDAFFQNLGIRAENVIADYFDAVAQLLGERLPSCPVVLRHPVFQKYDRELPGPISPVPRPSAQGSWIPHGI